MEALSKDENLVIKADNGWFTVIWGRDIYRKRLSINRRTQFNEQLTQNPVESLKEEIKHLLYPAKDNDWISECEGVFCGIREWHHFNATHDPYCTCVLWAVPESQANQ